MPCLFRNVGGSVRTRFVILDIKNLYAIVQNCGENVCGIQRMKSNSALTCLKHDFASNNGPGVSNRRSNQVYSLFSLAVSFLWRSRNSSVCCSETDSPDATDVAAFVFSLSSSSVVRTVPEAYVAFDLLAREGSTWYNFYAIVRGFRFPS